MKTGIYKILNIETQDFYIGSAMHFYNRKSKHITSLRNGTHNNKHLLHAFNKYGEDKFKFFLIEECPKENLPVLEQKYIDELKPHYNICTVVEGRWGLKHEELTKNKIREAVKKFHLEIGLSQESKNKISNTLKGTKQSPETIEKRRQANIKAWQIKKEATNGL